MKKLMITLMTAIASTMIMAATPTAQVYDVTLKVKTTAAATATVNNKQNPIAIGVDDGSCSIVYRKQSSTTWKGLIWGCGCETINGKWETVSNDCDGEVVQAKTVKGCILWDTKTKNPVYIGYDSDLTDSSTVPGCDFGWSILHAINKDGKQVEGTWTLKQNGSSCSENGCLFELVGSGFGSACVDVSDGSPTCLSYIKSIGGNFAGYMKAPSKTTVTSWSGCTYCGLQGGEVSCDLAEAWQWCDWYNYCSCDTGIDENLEYTTAYGTWTIKYNSSLSKKLAQPLKVTSKGVSGVVVSIRDVYNFKSLPYVEAAIEEVENKIWGVKTECEELLDEVTEKENLVKDAKQAVVDVSTTNLAAKLEIAKAEWSSANDELNNATTAKVASNMTYIAACNAYDSQMDFVTNNAWSVTYKNSSQDSVKVDGVGLGDFDDMVESLKNFTLTTVWYRDATAATGYITPPTYASAKKFVNEQNAKTASLLEAMNAAKLGLDYAKAVYEQKEETADELASKYSEANRRYEDRAQLQLLANQQLAIAETALENAKSNYESAGCK